MYHAVQSAPDESTARNDLAALDEKITMVRAELTSAKTTEENLRLHATALSRVMTMEELQSGVSDLECEKESLLARVVQLKKIEVQPTTAAERATIEGNHALWSKHVYARKRICEELFWKCLEVMPEGETADELWVSSFKLWRHPRMGDLS